jgi:hypothetical protein
VTKNAAAFTLGSATPDAFALTLAQCEFQARSLYGARVANGFRFTSFGLIFTGGVKNI